MRDVNDLLVASDAVLYEVTELVGINAAGQLAARVTRLDPAGMGGPLRFPRRW
jgi:hypothetical protein